MKNKALLVLYSVCLAFLLSSCGSIRRAVVGSQDAPKLYPIVQGRGGNIKFGSINPKGEVVIQPQFKQAWFFSEGLAVACIEYEKCGYIDETGKFMINPQFECEGAGDFVGGFSVLSSQVIDRQGKAIWKASKPAICDGEGA